MKEQNTEKNTPPRHHPRTCEYPLTNCRMWAPSPTIVALATDSANLLALDFLQQRLELTLKAALGS